MMSLFKPQKQNIVLTNFFSELVRLVLWRGVEGAALAEWTDSGRSTMGSRPGL